MQREQALIKTLIYLALSFVILTLPGNIYYFLILFKPGFKAKENYLLVILFFFQVKIIFELLSEVKVVLRMASGASCTIFLLANAYLSVFCNYAWS